MTVPDHLIDESFLASSGPGGQNVNKVATAVQLRVDVFALRLHPVVYRKLKTIAGRKMTRDGELVLTVREHRTQEANRREARERLNDMIAEAHRREARRVKTRPSRSAKRRRVEAKKRKSSIKKTRGRPSLD